MCLNSSSASVSCPFFINFNAAAYCCSACGGTGTGAGPAFAGAPTAAVALAAGVLSPWPLAAAAGAAGRASPAVEALAAGAVLEGVTLLDPAAPLEAALLSEAAALAGAEPLLLGAAFGTAA